MFVGPNILEMLDLLPQLFLRLDDRVELAINSLHVCIAICKLC